MPSLTEKLDSREWATGDKPAVTLHYLLVDVSDDLAAGDAADRTAQATEETAKNTKKLVKAATTGGLTFA